MACPTHTMFQQELYLHFLGLISLESCSNLAPTGFTIQKHTEKNEQESTGEPLEKPTQQ